jgi:hypothetical protein
MDPMLIMMGVFAIGLVICFRWAMYLIRNDKDVKINLRQISSTHNKCKHDPN